MPHCKICDFCETTPNVRNYQTDLIHHNNVVRFHDKLNDYYCTECLERIFVNKEIYQDDAAVFLAQFDLEEEEPPIATETVQSDSFAMSEV